MYMRSCAHRKYASISYECYHVYNNPHELPFDFNQFFWYYLHSIARVRVRFAHTALIVPKACVLDNYKDVVALNARKRGRSRADWRASAYLREKSSYATRGFLFDPSPEKVDSWPRDFV